MEILLEFFFHGIPYEITARIAYLFIFPEKTVQPGSRLQQFLNEFLKQVCKEFLQRLHFKRNSQSQSKEFSEIILEKGIIEESQYRLLGKPGINFWRNHKCDSWRNPGKAENKTKQSLLECRK